MVYPDTKQRIDNEHGYVIVQDYKTKNTITIVDYLDVWNDLMPLIIEHCDSFEVFKRIDGASVRAKDGYWYICINKNPQRALAECLLKVLESKDE